MAVEKIIVFYISEKYGKKSFHVYTLAVGNKDSLMHFCQIALDILNYIKVNLYHKHSQSVHPSLHQKLL